MKPRIIMLAALSFGFSAATATAQTMDGCYILGFEPGTGIPEYDCQYQKHGPAAPVFTGTWYAAIAKSAATFAWGASWHETTQENANKSAMQGCTHTGHNDCKIAITGSNNCLSMAESTPDGAWAASFSNFDRNDAIHAVVALCKKYGGRDCSVVVSPCGRDAVTTPPCLKTYPIDISRGEVWKHMTDEQKAMWNKKGNGVCK